MAASSQAILSPDQYLKIERAAEFRHEYFQGKMYAMSGTSYRHVVIKGNFTFHLRLGLNQRPCTVANNDLRLRISVDGLYTYPDVVVICGEPKFADNQKDTLLNPVLIIEVLSPSTEAYDRGFKSAQYRALESLQEYALVSQTEPRVEVFHRQAGGTWLLTEFIGLEAECNLKSVDCAIALSDVYTKVSFESDEPAA
jgi:Uma2 family endonuclease